MWRGVESTSRTAKRRQVDTLSLQHWEAQGGCIREHSQSRGNQHGTCAGQHEQGYPYTRRTGIPLIAACTGPANFLAEVALLRAPELGHMMQTLLWEQCPFQNHFNSPKIQGDALDTQGRQMCYGRESPRV